MSKRIQHIEIHQVLEHLRSRDLSPEEWASLEAQAVGDPFLLEALEGLRQIPVAQRTAHLQSIQRAITAKYSERRRPKLRVTLWMRAAASILLLIGVFWIVNQYILKNRNRIIAEDISLKNETIVAENDMGSTDSMPMTEARPETPAGSFEGPRMLSSPAETSKDEEKKDVMNKTASTGSERESAADEVRESDVDEGVSPATSARSAEPGSRATYPSETLIRDAEGHATSFRLPEVKGIVMNRSGEPVSGALVSVKGTNTETETDYLGNFALDIPNQNYRNALVISHFGYPPVEADVADGDSIIVRLQENASTGKTEITTLTQNRMSRSENQSTRSLAQPIGGDRSYNKYLRQNLRYPAQALSAGIHGSVVLEFDVSVDGIPWNFRIARSLGYGCDEEAIRLIRMGPKWNVSGAQAKIGRWEIEF